MTQPQSPPSQSVMLKHWFVINQDAQPVSRTASGQYVYGIRGIEKLFNVSHVTAQNYKNTILKDACMQRGRKIIVDVEKAVKLFNEFKQDGRKQ